MAFRSSLIVLDSKFRSDPINQTPANYYVTLQSAIQGATGLKLVSAQIPNTFYNISATKQNNTIVVNGITYTIPPGNYTLINLINYFNSNILNNIPDGAMSYSRSDTYLIISSSANFSMDLTDNFDMAALLGYDALLYSGSNIYNGTRPPTIKPLGIILNLDVVSNTVSLSNPRQRSCSFYIINSANSQEIVLYTENFNFPQYANPNSNIINSIHVTLSDSDGDPLENVGENVIILACKFPPIENAVETGPWY